MQCVHVYQWQWQGNTISQLCAHLHELCHGIIITILSMYCTIFHLETPCTGCPFEALQIIILYQCHTRMSFYTHVTVNISQGTRIQWNLQIKDTRQGQYKFTSFVLCREVVLFLEVVSVLKLQGRQFFGTSSSVPCREVFYIVPLSRRVHYRRFHCNFNKTTSKSPYYDFEVGKLLQVTELAMNYSLSLCGQSH